MGQAESDEDVEFWRLPTVKQKVARSKSEIYRLMSRGEFPRSRRKRGGNVAYWLSTEVRAWQRAQLVIDEEVAAFLG